MQKIVRFATGIKRNNRQGKPWFLRQAYRAVVLCCLALSLGLGSSQSAISAEPTGSTPCVIYVDDASSPSESKRHGIEAFDPIGLAYAFDTIGHSPCTLLYVAVRPEVAQVIPVITAIPVNHEQPPSPPENGLKLSELQVAWHVYQTNFTAYNERLQLFDSRREEDRKNFIVRSLGALAEAETEFSALHRSRGDVAGAILTAMSAAQTLRSSSVILILNSNLRDRSRKNPFTKDELPPDLVRGLVLVNTSVSPDNAPLIDGISIPKYHVSSLKAATDLAANLLSGIK